MAITILPPVLDGDIDPEFESSSSIAAGDDDDDSSNVDRVSRRRKVSSKHVVIPGETITSETQWMRLVHSNPVSLQQKSKNIFQRPWHV